MERWVYRERVRQLAEAVEHGERPEYTLPATVTSTRRRSPLRVLLKMREEPMPVVIRSCTSDHRGLPKPNWPARIMACYDCGLKAHMWHHVHPRINPLLVMALCASCHFERHHPKKERK